MRVLASANKDLMPSRVLCLMAYAADEKGQEKDILGSSLSFVSFRDL